MRYNPLCAMAAGETLTSASSAAGASNGQARAHATSSSLHDMPANAPFTRHDRYGHYGKAPQPLLEQLRLALMTVLVVPVRLGLTICIMLLVNIGCRCELAAKACCQLAYACTAVCNAAAVGCMLLYATYSLLTHLPQTPHNSFGLQQINVTHASLGSSCSSFLH